MSNYIVQIQAILLKSGLTQTGLAKRLGVTFAALNRWIQGHAQPRPARLAQIDRLYKDLVGFPDITEAKLPGALLQAQKTRVRRLWERVAKNAPLQDRLILEHTYNSNAIEGSTLSKKETEAVIFDKSVIRDRTLIEHLEATNHATLLRSILTRDIMGPVTEMLILKLHAQLMQGIRADAGKYSRHHRAIRGVDIPLTHPADIPEEMGELLRSWKRAEARGADPRDIAEFHVSLESIHPFGDGNGRVGRLLMVMQCLAGDYPPVLIENNRKAEYYEVLEYAQRKDSKPFVVFVCDEIRRAKTLLGPGFSK